MLYFSKLMSLLLILSFSARGSDDDFSKLETKIYSTISMVENSNLIFIRNEDEHTSKEAAAHIKRKYEFAIRSPFTPSKKDWTFDFFVKEIASKSSSSGKPYYVKLNDGSKVEMQSWLYSRMK